MTRQKPVTFKYDPPSDRKKKKEKSDEVVTLRRVFETTL